MAEITSGGYQTFRDFLNSSATTPNEWGYIEIYDDSQSAITRVSITGDSRCQWLDVDGDPILQVEFDVTGSDSDITLPVVIESAAIWNASSGGTQCTTKEQFAQATFNQSGDSVTITHNVEVPDQ